MKTTRFLTYAMAVAALLVAGSAQAVTLSVGGDYYVGFVDPSVPANVSDEAGYINTLITVAVGDSDTVGTRLFDRINGAGAGVVAPANPPGGVPGTLPSAGDGLKQDNNNTTTDITGADYVIGKYAGRMEVWYVGGLSDTSATLPGTGGNGNGLSHSTKFNGDNPDFDVPEPGSLALLGLGMLGLAYKRRRRTVH